VIVRALEGGNRLTRDELAAVLDRARIDRVGQRMPYILIHCELEALIASGGLSGKHQTYALLDERFPKGGKFGGGRPTGRAHTALPDEPWTGDRKGRELVVGAHDG